MLSSSLSWGGCWCVFWKRNMGSLNDEGVEVEIFPLLLGKGRSN
jgi:hypothetical protein